MIITFIRVIIIYIIVLFAMRLMGKREIGQLQPFELAIAIMIADLAAVPMADLGLPITSGIIPIFGITSNAFINIIYKYEKHFCKTGYMWET